MTNRSTGFVLFVAAYDYLAKNVMNVNTGLSVNKKVEDIIEAN